MKLNTYLTFNGNARQAMEFYKDVLGGEMTTMATFGEGPMDVDEKYRDHVMHAHLTLEHGGEIMASDTGGHREPAVGDNFHLSLNLEDKDAGKALIDRLSEGGTVTFAFSEVFWGGHFGSCTDQFGINWMVSTP